MAYYLGKDVSVYMTTEQYYVAVYPNASETTSGSYLTAITDSSGSTTSLVRSRSNGIATTTQLSDITGIDFTPGATNEDISYMGRNTNLSAQVKHEFSISLTKKKNDRVWDELFNDRGRDGCYVQTAAGVITADAQYNSTNVGIVHDGLTTSRLQNFGYRVYLVLKDSAEVFVLRNSCITGHTVSLNADGTQEETLELYSYVNPVLTNTTDATSTHAITGLTAMADI